MKCQICGQDHADQVTALMQGAMVDLDLGDGIVVRGTVVDHCDDGRAIIKTSEQGVHTFHFWKDSIKVIKPGNDYWYVIQQKDENGQWYDIITAWDLGELQPTEANFRTVLAQLRQSHPTLTYQLLREEVIG